MKPLLAIVIPYYKIDFFEETLKSVAAQTDKCFVLYIGNDASPDDPLPLIEKYFPDGNYYYINYAENLGGKNLAMQWERILDSVKEDWFQILGDDDVISDNFVEAFYRNLQSFSNVNYIKVSSIIVDETGKVQFSKTHSIEQGSYSPVDFFLDKLEGRINSSLSEHIFRNSIYKRIKFRKYPLAWHSDDLIQIEISDTNTAFYFISEALVKVKETCKSISGSMNNQTEKNRATIQFLNDVLLLLKKATILQRNRYAQFLIDNHPEIPAKKVYLSLFSFETVLPKMLRFYSSRILNRHLHWERRSAQVEKQWQRAVYRFRIATNSTLIRQRKKPLSIPVIIINYNQLYYLKKLIAFLVERGFENIVIVDNCSDYPPLLKYYDEIKEKVTIEHMDDNYGHMVFFENERLQAKYAKGYFVLTDADIVPNPNLPLNFMQDMITILDKHYTLGTKVGFALQIDDIPDSYPLKEKVKKWEKQFWQRRIQKDVFEAWIDTTFALYKPGYSYVGRETFLKGLRIGGNFTAKHGGWYLSPNNLTEEQKYYLNSVNSSSSWRIDEKGNHLSEEYNTYVK